MNDTEIIHQFAVKNMLVERYLLGELSGTNRDDFERHMWECAICFEAVKAGQVFTESITGVYLRKGPLALVGELWQRTREFFVGCWKQKKGNCAILMLLQLGPLPSSPPPSGTLPWFSIVSGVFLAGLATGVLGMAVLQRRAQRRKTTDRDGLGNRIGELYRNGAGMGGIRKTSGRRS
jgi:hypothetical protein